MDATTPAPPAVAGAVVGVAPAVDASGGAVVGVASATDASGGAWLGLALVLLLVPVAAIDLRSRVIPNALLAPGAAVAVALVAALRPQRLPEHVAAAAAAGGFFLAAALVRPSAMGMGDVKLAAVLGLFLGRGVAAAVLVALVAGTVAGAVVVARRGVRAGRTTAIAFGPCLALGGLAGLLAGEAVADWYVTAFAPS